MRRKVATIEEEEVKPKTKVTRKKNPQTAQDNNVTATSSSSQVSLTKAFDPYQVSRNSWNTIKSNSDLYITVQYQSIQISVSQNVKSEFFEVVAAGCQRVGFDFSRYNRTVYINNITPNYDINDVLDVINIIADAYKLKTHLVDNSNVASPKVASPTMQQQIMEVIHKYS